MAASALAALDRLNQGIAIVAPGGQIRFANRSIHRLAREADGLRMREGALSATEMRDALRLRDALKSAAIGSPEIALRLSRASGKRPLFLLISALEPPCPTPDAAPAQVLVLVADAELELPSVKAPLSQAYGLTATEGAVAQLLLQGSDVARAARAMGIRIATARTHLQHLLAKTGTHRQSDLVRVLMREIGGAG